ncbi:heterokaryon incompatibility protein-domain-containing protein [Xylariales sp. PMI_506]|nr:heterokaryon incompatibility protein-domain-containing protein [Xylariales sp. PMI_506]
MGNLDGVEPYNYSPISNPTTATRGLRLHSRRKNATADYLSCSLLEVSLQHVVQYEAISYAWGGQTPDRYIVCDGRKMLVTKNCEDALRRFQYEDEDRLLWIDGICIDQSPNTVHERSIQVGLMGRIYSEAHKVLVWLGSDASSVFENGNVATAISWMKQVSVWAVLGTSLEGSKTPGGVTISPQNALGIHYPPSITNPLFLLSRNYSSLLTMQGLAFMTSKIPWFRRLWTFQEVALSKEALLFLGQDVIVFQHFLQRLCRFIRDVDGTDSGLDESLKSVAGLFLAHLSFLSHKANPTSALYKLPYIGSATATQLMHGTRVFQVTEPHDRIYAVYGLLQKMGLENLPRPDYDQPVATVFRDVAKVLIEHSASFSLILQAEGFSKTPGLPSWVPDWNWDSPAGPVPEMRATPYSINENFEFSEDGSKLHVEGLVVDVVQSRTARIPETNVELGFVDFSPPDPLWEDALTKTGGSFRRAVAHVWLMRTFREFITFATGGDFALIDNDDAMKALFGTVGFLQHYVARPEHRLEYIQNNLGLLRAWCKVIAYGELPLHYSESGSLNSRPLAKRLSMDVNNIEQEPSLQPLLHTAEFKSYKIMSTSVGLSNFHVEVERQTQEKALIKLSSGRLGLAMDAIRPEDEIVIIPGLPAPLAIRRQGRDVLLVCSVYANEISYGAAWREDISVDDLEDFWFV